MTAVDRLAPGYRAAPRHQPHNAFDGVGPGLWRCSRCHGPGSFSNPLRIVEAPDRSGPYSHVFVHESGCAA